MKKFVYLASAFCLVVLSVSAKADTLKFNGSSSEIGPYSMTLDGTTQVNLFCMDDQREIQQGESWNVNIVNGSSYFGSASGSSGFEYEEEAFILSQLGQASNGHGGTYSNTDVQNAIWKIFDPSENIYGDRNAQQLVSLAAGFDGYTQSFLSGYDFYIPTGTGITNGYGLGLPQEMIGTALPGTVPTPEPSSLLLMGSGLAGLAGLVRRKFARV